jgi:Legionella pneumophila major outer membrane protein precursor
MKTKIRNLMGVGAAFALLLSAQPATAQQCCPQPDPCCNPCTDWCDMCGDWEVGAHALYFVPVTCAYDFAINSPGLDTLGSASGQVSALKCSADWGFRVFGRYLSDCSFIGLSYQWFDSKTSGSRTGERLMIPGGGVAVTNGKVEARQTLEYQNVDLRWGKYLHRACGCNFYLFGNARWVDLSYRRSIRQTDSATGSIQQVTGKSELQGGALGIGAGADLDLWCDFGLFGDANLLGVIAERSTENIVYQPFAANDQIATRTATYPSDTCINPEMNFRLGINYRYTCGCWTVVGELGYEVDYFWDAVAFPTLTDGNLLISNTWNRRCQNVGFSGLFFGGRLLF